jgi:hypothetical protein
MGGVYTPRAATLITSYFDEIIITECAKPENKSLEGLTLRKAAARTGNPASARRDRRRYDCYRTTHAHRLLR